MQVWMMGHRRSPGVQHGSKANAGTEVFGIGGERTQGLGARLEQPIVEQRFILIGDLGDGCGQSEYEVVVFDGEQLRLPIGEPLLGSKTLTFRAVPITTRVVSDLHRITVVTPQDMSTEFCPATLFNRRHHLELPEGHVPAIFQTPREALVAENIRDLQGRPSHDNGSAR